MFRSAVGRAGCRTMAIAAARLAAAGFATALVAGVALAGVGAVPHAVARGFEAQAVGDGSGFAAPPADRGPATFDAEVAGTLGLEAAGASDPRTPSLAAPAGEASLASATLVRPSPWVTGEFMAAAPAAATRPKDDPPVLGAARARVLLRSITVPGWGQATLGRKTSATVFGLTELGIWVSFTSFKIQEQMRRESYERTARFLAGIDLRGRDQEFRRIVGSYLSSDQYNQFVVYRDAANLYYEDPVAYRAYIAEHSIGGADAWAWNGVESLLRYRDQRRAADRAGLRANTALALAVINRLLSALHAARYDPNEQVAEVAAPAEPSWALEVSPVHGGNPAAIRLGVRRRF